MSSFFRGLGKYTQRTTMFPSIPNTINTPRHIVNGSIASAYRDVRLSVLSSIWNTLHSTLVTLVKIIFPFNCNKQNLTSVMLSRTNFNVQCFEMFRNGLPEVTKTNSLMCMNMLCTHVIEKEITFYKKYINIDIIIKNDLT